MSTESGASRRTLVLGPEELLVDRAVQGVVRAARDEDPGAEVSDLRAAELEPGRLLELSSPSLFGETSVLAVRGLHEAGDPVLAELRRLVEDLPEHVRMVLVHRGGARGKALLDAARAAGAVEVSCAEVKTRRDKLAFITAEFAAQHRRVTTETVEAVLDAVGGDLRTLAAAIGQLTSDVEGRITVEDVRRYHDGRPEASGFVVADRAVEGACAPALAELRWALHAGTDPVPIVAALATTLRSVVRINSSRHGLSKADLAREVGVPPWKVDVVRRQARGWTAESVSVALRAVADADSAVKGGGVDAAYAVEKAVMAITRARGAAGRA